MLRGHYIAGTGMMLQRRLMENITNNITNVDTTGYKKNYLVSHSFDDVMARRINDGAMSTTIGPFNYGTRVDQVYIDYSRQGSFEETGTATDMALVGDVYFVMETAAGERYSKAGAFVVNSEGYLTDGAGNYLLGRNGRIYVGGDTFAVDELGNVAVDGQVTNTIRIVTFDDMNALRRQGNNLYFNTGGAAVETTNYAVLQGFVEGSNVEAAREMVDMITVYRAYETNQRILTMIDDTIGKAVNDIGRLR